MFRFRLFWHILGAFLLTLLLLGLALSILYRTPPLSDRPIYRFVSAMMTGLEHTLEVAGPDEARQQVARYPDQIREQIRIEVAPSGTVRPESTLLKFPLGPDGRRYRVEYVPNTQSFVDGLPTPVLSGVLFAGLLFSIMWAYHLSKPLRILSTGFRRLSEGDLDTRLDPAITRHSHEFAQLAENFARMTSRLRQLVVARERLLHDVSHELRSPLTRLQLAIGLLRQDPANAATSLDRIEREAGKLNLLIDELLTLAWAEGSLDPPEDYFDPVESIREVADAARLEAAEKLVAIALHTSHGASDEPPVMVGSANLLQRALDNVLRNAIRHAPRGSTIEVSVELESGGDEYRIAVRDHGPGVPPELLARMCEPFVRDAPEGTGLGLSIAERAAHALKGQLAMSNHEGGGLLAEFRFPALALVPATPGQGGM